jgi:hypothetical protein
VRRGEHRTRRRAAAPLDKLTLRDVRGWLNKLRDTCQYCAQGKDARRAEKQRRCCARVPAICCRRLASERTIRDAWTILCSALTNAVTEELIPKNVASLAHVSKPRTRKVKPWTAEEAPVPGVGEAGSASRKLTVPPENWASPK